MRILSIDKVKEGDLLGKSLFQDGSRLLLAAGYTLTADMISLLKKRGTRYIYIMDEASEGITPEDVISDTVRQIADAKLADTFKNVQKNLAFESFAPDKIKQRLASNEIRAMVRMPEIRKLVGTLLEEIIDNQISMLTSLPVRSEEDLQSEHALETTVLSILIARTFNFDYPELKALGSAAMLHDIGKQIFPTLLNRPSNELSRDEKAMLLEHPVYSRQILEQSEPDAFQEQIAVLQHHEQNDGRGYPQRLNGIGKPPASNRKDDAGFIHRFAEIIAVANVYDNLLTGSFNGKTHTPAEAIARILTGDTGGWNYYVIRALLNVVQCYPVGVTVKIKQNHSGSYVGYTGVVAQANPKDQSMPSIVLTHNSIGAEIRPQLVDFSHERHMTIELAI